MVAASAEHRFSWLDIYAGAAARIGGRIDWTDEFGRAGVIILPCGKRLFFHKGILGVNAFANARIARDKGFTTDFLRSRGFRVPEERIFFSANYAKRKQIDRGPDAARDYATELGFPVYVKPVHMSQGRGVAKVFDSIELAQAIDLILQDDRMFLVQPVYAGADVRVIVVNGTVLFGYERVPLTVVGDGESTIKLLLERLQQAFIEDGRDTIIDPQDWRLQCNLQRQQLALTDVLPAGASIRLQDIANLSVGGVAIERTEMLTGLVGGVAREIATALQLGFCGIDFLIADLANPAASHVILEVNSAPGLDNYNYAGRNPLDYTQSLYATLLLALSTTKPPWNE